MVFAQLHPRDELGRFAEVEDEAGLPSQSTPTIAPAHVRQLRKPRRARRARQLRRSVTARPAVEAQATEARTAVRAPAERSVFRQAMAAHARTNARALGKALPQLPDWQHYKLFRGSTFEQWAEENLDYGEKADLEVPGQSVQLHVVARQGLARGDPLPLGELAHELAVNVQNDLTMERHPIRKTLAMLDRTAVLDDEALAMEVHKAFERDPKVDIIEIVHRGSKVFLYGNAKPVDPQHVIQFEPHIDWRKPVYLTYAGQHRARDIHLVDRQGDADSLVDFDRALGEEKAGEGAVPNPRVNIYRVTSSRVNLFRASNPD
jgi:hypothetical protein